MTTTNLQFGAIVQVTDVCGRFWIADGQRREMSERHGWPLFGFDQWFSGNADYVLNVGDTVIVDGLEYRICIAGNEIILV